MKEKNNMCKWKTSVGQKSWFCFHFLQLFLRIIALANVFQPFSCVKNSKESYSFNLSKICLRVKIGTYYQRNFPGWNPNS